MLTFWRPPPEQVSLQHLPVQLILLPPLEPIFKQPPPMQFSLPLLPKQTSLQPRLMLVTLLSPLKQAF